MNEIFISYRRADDPKAAQLLGMCLEESFGKEAVFLDVNMKEGSDFPDTLVGAISNCEVVVAMIGNNWRGEKGETDRFQSDNDWVKKELTFALQFKKVIIPVFLENCKIDEMFNHLPEVLKDLPGKNAISPRDLRFRHEIAPMITAIGTYVEFTDPLKELPLPKEGLEYPSPSPFRGLEHFSETEARCFFGQGKEIATIFTKIKNARILFFYGISGVGKSSLLHAGLFPRLKKQRWKIKYFRRDPKKNFVDILNGYLEDHKSDKKNKKFLIILDQVEEIYTNPTISVNLNPEKEASDLFRKILEIAQDTEWKFIISFRNEYLAVLEDDYNRQLKEIETNVDLKRPITSNKHLLKSLSARGVSEAIWGISKDKDAKVVYRFEFESNDVPFEIAKKVTNDVKGNVAPWLQVILSKMFDEVERNYQRIFTKELLDRVSNNNFEDFVTKEIDSLKGNFPNAYNSGLVLDVLHFFITDRVTSQSRSIEEIKKTYSNQEKAVLDLINALKNKYLLSENMDENTAKVLEGYRLSHDTLAPIINKLYINSNLPGQRAAAILSSKRKDFENNIAIEFSKTDLNILEAGKLGMRAWTDLEEAVFQENLERVSKEEKELEEAHSEVKNQLARYYWEMGKMAKEKMELTKFLLCFGKALGLSNDIHLKSNMLFVGQNYMPTAMLDQKFLQEYYHCIVRLHRDESRILTWGDDGAVRIYDYHTGKQVGKSMFHEKSVNGAVFNQDESHILTWSRDGTARLWDSWTGEQLGKSMIHEKSVYGAVFNLDESQILTWSDDGTAKLWKSGTGEQVGKSMVHGDDVNGAIFNREENQILTWSDDGSAMLWDSGTGEQVGIPMKHEGSVDGAIFNKDENRILTWSRDGSARLWDSKTWEEVGKPIEHGDAIEYAYFNQDESRILTFSFKRTKLWDCETRNMVGKTIEHKGMFNKVPINRDRSRILTWGDDSTVRLWDSKTGKQVGKTMQHEGLVYGASFNRDESRILTWSDDGTARLWTSGTGDQYGKSMMHGGSIKTAFFSRDENRILTKSVDSTLKIWDSETKDQVGKTMEHLGGILGAVFTNDESSVLATDQKGRVCLWKLRKTENGQILMKHEDQVMGANFNKNESLILTWSADGSTKLWDSMTGVQEGDTMMHDNRVIGAIFNPFDSCVLTWSVDETARLWKIGTGRQIGLAMQHDGGVFGAVFNEDGSRILTYSEDDTARLWDTQTGLQVGQSMMHENWLEGAVFNKEEDRILTWSRDGITKLWDIRTGEQVGKSKEHNETVNGALFNNDQSRILTWSSDGSAKLWDSSTGELVGQPMVHGKSVRGALFDGNETRIMTWSEDGTVRFWDSMTSKPTGKFIQHGGSVFGAVFNRDESRILTWGRDRTVRLWDTATRELVCKPMEHGDWVSGAVFNRDESIVLTWSKDGTARLWDSRTGEQVCKSMKHDGSVKRALFNMDECRILTWSDDGTARLWDRRTEEQVDIPMKHEGSVYGALFSRNENSILTWSGDGTAILWDIEADLDFPPEHFSLQVEAFTGTTLNINILEVEVMEPEVWKAIKAKYEELAREHYKVCKHPKANWWAKFNPEEAKKLRPEVE